MMKHILISDQDSILFQAGKEALQNNYKVAPLSVTSELGRDKINQPVELILLTISEANLESFRLYELIKQIPEMLGKPVIFLAWQRDMEQEKRALSAGAEDYIAMPVSPDLLRQRVATCLELCSLRSNRSYAEKYQDAIAISIAELMECRDETTGGHLKSATQYFNILLEEAIANDYYKEIIPLEEVQDLLRSVMLHDIGKIGINDEILRKSSSLDYKEYESMKTHTTLGKQAFDRIIRETGGTRWLYLAKDIAYCHHERWDGTGYPNRLKGDEIPIYARMLTVADVYDALTSTRTYKEAYSHEKALGIMIEEKGKLFDPKLVDLFMNANERFEELLLQKATRNQ